MNSPAKPRTIPALFEESCAHYASNMLLWEKRDGGYQGASYLEVRNLAHQCAAGLLALGIGSGDRIALLSEGRNDWLISELGILYAGAANVPLSTKIEELDELKFRLAHSGCRMVFVSAAQLPKILSVRQGLPELERIILLDGSKGHGAPGQRTLGFLLDQGKEFLSTRSEAFEHRWRSIEEGDPANICYTSGTTADPKGIILTHRNCTANAEQARDILDFPSNFQTLLILPWDHAFAHTVIYMLVLRGAAIASVQQGKSPAETLRNIPVNLREFRPTFLLSVPALAKNFRKNVERGIREKGKRVERIFRNALDAAYAYNRDGFTRGQGASLWLRLRLRLYDRLIFRKIREGFGGRLEYFIGGGAVLDEELQKFFYALGIPMHQGYGLTEAGPVVSANVPGRHKMGTSGSILPRIELHICDELERELPTGQSGEIVLRGENVMAGYWKNDKATSEVLRGGWLHTGDVGYLDADGFLHVQGRRKSLLIGHDAEKYSPEAIEEAIVARSPFFEQIMLYNNQSRYTSALVVPNGTALKAWLEERCLSAETEKGQDAALSLLQSEIDSFRLGGKNSGMFPERWLPAAMALLEEGFTEQNRMLNSTLKVVRGRVVEACKDRLAYLYTPEGKNIFNPQNRLVLRNTVTGYVFPDLKSGNT